MFSRLLILLRTTPDRQRLLLFVFCTALAGAIGFGGMALLTVERLIIHGGYYYMLGLFSLFVYFGWRVAAQRRSVWLGWLRHPGRVGLVLGGATLFAIWADPFKHKILYDEYVLQGTAWHMHATKEITAPVRAYDFSGTWQVIDGFLDKRPYFYAFLVALLHDLIGFRVANAFVLNVALTPICLALVYWLARELAGCRRLPALLAVALLATLPVFAQNVSGAGMELHNLVMIVLVMALAVLYLRAPDDDRLALLVFGAVLLAQSRYESALFVMPVALVIVLGWLRISRVLLPWPAVIAPLLLVPYAWQHRVVSASPILWQLRPGETSRFGFRYLAGNLEGTRRFFFGHTPDLSNSWWFTVVGIVAAAWACVRVWFYFRRPRSERGSLAPEVVVLTAFGAIILANLALLMFYYWSRLDEPIASRFALPAYLFLALLAAWGVSDGDLRRVPATRLAAFGLAVWLLVWGAPAYARRLYTSQNLVMQELDWELDELTAHHEPLLLISNKATMPFLMMHIPTVNTPTARARSAQIAWHVHEGTFHEVYVAQALRPTSAAGEIGVEPEDVLPENFHLQTVAVKRFGARWDRISRVVKIDSEPAKENESQETPPTRSDKILPDSRTQ